MPLARIVRWTRELRLSAGLEAHQVLPSSDVPHLQRRPLCGILVPVVGCVWRSLATRRKEPCIHRLCIFESNLLRWLKIICGRPCLILPYSCRRSTLSSRRPSTSARCCCWTPPPATCWRCCRTGGAPCERCLTRHLVRNLLAPNPPAVMLLNPAVDRMQNMRSAAATISIFM